MPVVKDIARAARARARRILVWLIRLRGSPHAIALGMAIGLFVAFTPTVGLQAVLALILATLFNANRPVAIVPIWITNPFTMAPIYGFTYYIGSLFWSGPSSNAGGGEILAGAEALESLDPLDPLSLGERIAALLDTGLDVFVPLWIGGVLVGLFAAAVGYSLTLRAVAFMRERRNARRRRRAARARRASNPSNSSGMRDV